jgi:murein tripeptide amidase MpaA
MLSSGKKSRKWMPVFRGYHFAIAVLATALLVPAMVAKTAVATTPAPTPIVSTTKTTSYARMESDLKMLQNRYPDLITLEVYGTSFYGRKLYAARLTGPLQQNQSLETTESTSTIEPTPEKRPAALINSSHHGREWITTTLGLYMLEQYCQAYQAGTLIGGYDVKEVLDQSEIWFIPMVNPDGVAISQSGLKSVPKKHRKNVRRWNQKKKSYTRWKANGQGIDLNRQYDVAWKQVRSSRKPTYIGYKGKRPLQARESKALVNLTLRVDPQIEVAYHSAGKVMFWGYKQTGIQRSRDLALAQQISIITGYRLMPNTSTAGAGGYTDWFTNKLKRPGFTLELTTGKKGKSNLNEFRQTWNENQTVGLFLAVEAAKLAQ